MDIEITLVTCPSMQLAREIAGAVVEEKLAACVNIVPGLESCYFWEGEVQYDSEILLVIKSTEAKRAALESRVHELHSYDTPEFITWKPDSGSQSYIDWLRNYVSS